MGEVAATAIGNVPARGYRRGTVATDPWDQFVIPTTDKIVSYRGHASTFRTIGRTLARQNILSIHNAAASTVLVDVNKITVDFSATAVKALGVLPPIIRLWRVTVLPTNGTAITKVAEDSALTTSTSVTLLQDASADGTSSTTTLTATLPANNVITQEYTSRIITGAGIELMDRAEFLTDGDITLRALEGLVVSLDAVVTTGFIATDSVLATVRWTEYTRP